MVTRSKSPNILRESSTISFGMVAEKKSDCLFGGSFAMIFLISCMKPMSNIWSASSKTTCSKSLKDIKPWFIKSNKRPGVAIMISTPPLNALTCLPCLTPPKITVLRSPVCLPYAVKLSPI